MIIHAEKSIMKLIAKILNQITLIKKIVKS